MEHPSDVAPVRGVATPHPILASVFNLHGATSRARRWNFPLRMVIALGLLGLVLSATLYVASTSASAQSYVVKQGDTLTSIAQAFHTSVSALVSVNHLTNPDRLTVGEALVVGAPDAVSATSLSTVTAAGIMTYVVQAGDTLAALGRRFGLSEAALAAANGLVNPIVLVLGRRW